jgi:2-polyprenyl-6-methoxyphenol hydroxylase-like FAD-dependent oxidoreductase
MKPVNILGSGLAGLALGNALQRDGVPVTLFEAGSLPRHRVCGEFICGRGGDALRSLGLSDALADAHAHTSTVWYTGGRKVLERDLPKPAIGLSRYTLDKRLAAAFQKVGGRLELNQRKKFPAQAEGIVHCCGRKAVRSDWIGLKLHCKNLTIEADLELHLGNGSYVGLSQVEHDRVNVCALFKQIPGLKAKREDALPLHLEHCGLAYVSERLRAADIVDNSHSGVAGVEFSRIPKDTPNTIHLGDAYSLIPPFTGNGMSIALEAAEIAYPTLRDYASGHLGWPEAVHRINASQHKAFDGRLRAARWLHPLIHSRTGQRSLGTLAKAHLLPFSLLYSLTH